MRLADIGRRGNFDFCVSLAAQVYITGKCGLSPSYVGLTEEQIVRLRETLDSQAQIEIADDGVVSVKETDSTLGDLSLMLSQMSPQLVAIRIRQTEKPALVFRYLPAVIICFNDAGTKEEIDVGLTGELMHDKLWGMLGDGFKNELEAIANELDEKEVEMPESLLRVLGFTEVTVIDPGRITRGLMPDIGEF